MPLGNRRKRRGRLRLWWPRRGSSGRSCWHLLSLGDEFFELLAAAIAVDDNRLPHVVISHLCVVAAIVPKVFHDVVIDHFFGCCAHSFVPALCVCVCVLKIRSPSRLGARQQVRQKTCLACPCLSLCPNPSTYQTLAGLATQAHS